MVLSQMTSFVSVGEPSVVLVMFFIVIDVIKKQLSITLRHKCIYCATPYIAWANKQTACIYTSLLYTSYQCEAYARHRSKELRLQNVWMNYNMEHQL